MWATLWSRTATSLATASTSRRGLKDWRNRAGSAYRHECRRTQRVGSISPSRIWASSSSRTLPGRCASSVSVGIGLREATHTPAPSLALPDKPSVAVLPFTNMSGDPGAGILRRRHRRGHHYGAVALSVAVRHRAQLLLHLQGPRGRREAGRARAGRALCARRQRAQSRQPHPRHRAAGRGRDRQARLGRALRPRSRRHFRSAGRDHRGSDDRHGARHCRCRAAPRLAQAAGKPRRLGRLSTRFVASQ